MKEDGSDQKYDGVVFEYEIVSWESGSYEPILKKVLTALDYNLYK